MMAPACFCRPYQCAVSQSGSICRSKGQPSAQRVTALENFQAFAFRAALTDVLEHMPASARAERAAQAAEGCLLIQRATAQKGVAASSGRVSIATTRAAQRPSRLSRGHQAEQCWSLLEPASKQEARPPPLSTLRQTQTCSESGMQAMPGALADSSPA